MKNKNSDLVPLRRQFIKPLIFCFWGGGGGPKQIAYAVGTCSAAGNTVAHRGNCIFLVVIHNLLPQRVSDVEKHVCFHFTFTFVQQTNPSR